jgi:hypothetical protein
VYGHHSNGKILAIVEARLWQQEVKNITGHSSS